MFYFLLFLFELVLLFFLSKRLINAFAIMIFRLTKNHRAVVNILAIIFLPGTIFHELAHLLFAGIMFVPVGELNVLPEIEGDSVRLGSVQIGKTDPLRGIIAGVAPVLLGMILIFSIFLFVKIGVSPWWQVILAVYLLFEISNTMFSSRKDIEGVIGFAVAVLVVTVTILVALYFLNPVLLQNLWFFISILNFDFFIDFFKLAAIYLIVPIVLDILIILISK